MSVNETLTQILYEIRDLRIEVRKLAKVVNEKLATKPPINLVDYPTAKPRHPEGVSDEMITDMTSVWGRMKAIVEPALLPDDIFHELAGAPEYVRLEDSELYMYTSTTTALTRTLLGEVVELGDEHLVEDELRKYFLRNTTGQLNHIFEAARRRKNERLTQTASIFCVAYPLDRTELAFELRFFMNKAGRTWDVFGDPLTAIHLGNVDVIPSIMPEMFEPRNTHWYFEYAV